jgi:hypothetical protein
MMNVAVVAYGYFLGLLNGCFLCRKFFPFNPKEASLKNRVIRGIVGSIFIVFILKYIVSFFIMNQTHSIIAFPGMFITGLFITLIYPIIFRYFDKKDSPAEI